MGVTRTGTVPLLFDLLVASRPLSDAQAKICRSQVRTDSFLILDALDWPVADWRLSASLLAKRTGLGRQSMQQSAIFCMIIPLYLAA